MPITTCVFDAYGTLFDVSAAAREAAAAPGGAALAAIWPRLAEIWRQKQLQYTWIRALTGAHADFAEVTGDALDFALEAVGVDPEGTEGQALRPMLWSLYARLGAYGDAEPCLRALKGAGLQTAILSNGAPAMLDTAVGAAGLGPHLDRVLSVEMVGVFKPHPKVYGLVERALGATPDEVLFVSSNGWDAAGARGFGFASLWVNRAGDPVDRLPWRPTRIAPDLSAVPSLLGELS